MVVEIYSFLKTSFSWSCFLYKDFCKIHDTTACDRCLDFRKNRKKECHSGKQNHKLLTMKLTSVQD